MKKVVSFSLWGSDPKYNIGAINNSFLMKEIYPGWEAWFYCGSSVPEITMKKLENSGAKVIKMEEPGDWTGMFWRFLPAADPDVETMISRDTDSRISIREKLAVDEWIASGKSFHIMRDHPAHGIEMLGGMWGVRNGALKDIKELISGFTKGDFWQVDQNFLKDSVYPRARLDCHVNDEFFEKKPFPSPRKDLEFVGDVFDENDIRHPEHWKALSTIKRTPRILMVQERGRHEKNRNYRESENFRRAFKSLGVECEVWGLGHDNFNIPFEKMQEPYDVIFVMENYDEIGWLPDFSSCKKLKFFWSIDSHCGSVPRHRKFCYDSKIDVLLNSSEQYIQYFEGTAKVGVWFPNAYPDDLIFPDCSINKKYDVGFCGSMIADRPTWIPRLESRYRDKFKKDIFVIGDEMVDAIRSYKIGVNKCIADDINYRTFETLGCGTMLVTNRVPNIEKLFIDGEHLALYNTIEEMIEKIDYYLNNQDEMVRISKKGYDHVKKFHTYFERAKLFLNFIENV